MRRQSYVSTSRAASTLQSSLHNSETTNTGGCPGQSQAQLPPLAPHKSQSAVAVPSMVQTLQIKLDNLHLTTTDEDDLADREEDAAAKDKDKRKVKSQVLPGPDQKVGKAVSHVTVLDKDREMDTDQVDQMSNRSAQGTQGLAGLGKKRTYRELERWDIEMKKSHRTFR